jgi:hypothetical protein
VSGDGADGADDQSPRRALCELRVLPLFGVVLDAIRDLPARARNERRRKTTKACGDARKWFLRE